MTVRAGLPPPRVADPMDAPPLRWGILGPGRIARTFAAAVVSGTRGSVVAVGSRELGRAEAFARDFDATPYGSYAQLVADDRVDAVYVASPHSAHREHALLAIAAGRSVLVEKAFTRNRAEADEVLSAAAETGVFAMEAMWSRFLPHYDVVRRAVEGGLLGAVQQITVDHGQLLYPDGPARLRLPELAGGALLDLGVYPVSFAAMLLGPVDDLRVIGRLTPEGVDAEAAALLRSGEVLAVATTSMTAAGANRACVAGTAARLELDGWFYQPTTVRLVAGREELTTFTPPDPAHGMRYEAAEVARGVAEGRLESPLMPWTETRRVMGLLDEIRARLGVTYPGERSPAR